MGGVRNIKDIEDLQEELEDRFGDPPKPVWEALGILRMRLKCKEIGIASMRVEGANVSIRFAPSVRLTQDAVKLLTFAFKGNRFNADGVTLPLKGPKVMPQVEEMVSTLEKALSYGKNGNRK